LETGVGLDEPNRLDGKQGDPGTVATSGSALAEGTNNGVDQ
jgi:hypothetical protein